MRMMPARRRRECGSRWSSFVVPFRVTDMALFRHCLRRKTRDLRQRLVWGGRKPGAPIPCRRGASRASLEQREDRPGFAPRHPAPALCQGGLSPRAFRWRLSAVTRQHVRARQGLSGEGREVAQCWPSSTHLPVTVPTMCRLACRVASGLAPPVSPEWKAAEKGAKRANDAAVALGPIRRRRTPLATAEPLVPSP